MLLLSVVRRRPDLNASLILRSCRVSNFTTTSVAMGCSIFSELVFVLFCGENSSQSWTGW
jgi:hypothetical protein